MNESEIVALLEGENEEFKKLGVEHADLDKQLTEMQSRVYLTPEEEVEKKRLQKLKLQKKDQRAALIKSYRNSA